MRKLLSILGLVLSCVLTQSAAVNWTNYVPNIQVATNANVANQLQLGTTFTDGHLWPSAPDGTPNYILKTTSDHTTGNIFEIWEHTDRVLAIDWAWMLYVPDITLTGDAYVQGTVRGNDIVGTNTVNAGFVFSTNGINIVVGGSFTAPLTTNPLTLTTNQCYNSTLFYGATGQINLPAGKVGMNLVIYNTGVFTITVEPNGVEVIVRDGVAQAGGVNFTLSAGAGNFVSLIWDGTNWVTIGYKGVLNEGA